MPTYHDNKLVMDGFFPISHHGKSIRVSVHCIRFFTQKMIMEQSIQFCWLNILTEVFKKAKLSQVFSNTYSVVYSFIFVLTHCLKYSIKIFFKPLELAVLPWWFNMTQHITKKQKHEMFVLFGTPFLRQYWSHLIKW